jgi:flagellar biosynthesis GTPase FlhF
MKPVIIIAIVFVLLFASINVSAYALSEGDQIRNEYCKFQKQQDPNFDCEHITESSIRVPSKTTNLISESSDVSSNRQTESIGNTSDEDSIGAIIIIVIFLIISPIMFRTVWRNHSRIPSDSSYGAHTSRSAHSTEQNRGKDAQSRYEEFTQRREEKRKKGKRPKREQAEREREEQFRREQAEREREEQSRREQAERERKEQFRREQAEREKERHRSEQESSNFSLSECYEILELDETATSVQIKAARNRLALQWHPDKHRSITRKEMAEKEIKKINTAYEKLHESGKV